MIRIAPHGDGWIDPSTVRLNYTLNNTAGAALILRPIGGPWSLFSRVRCQYQGAICDDISDYNRTHEMMQILTSKANRDNDDISGFGRRWMTNIIIQLAQAGFVAAGDFMEILNTALEE